MHLIIFLIANTVNEMFKIFYLTHFRLMFPFHIPFQGVQNGKIGQK